jgi:hypothetical protein
MTPIDANGLAKPPGTRGQPEKIWQSASFHHGRNARCRLDRPQQH